MYTVVHLHCNTYEENKNKKPTATRDLEITDKKDFI